MCFPNKKQKDNFTDLDKPVAKTTKAESSSSSVPPAKPEASTTQVNGTMSRSPKVAIVIYSLYHHVAQMAEAVKVGIETAGGKADILQVPETLSADILTLMHAPPKPDYPVLTLEKFAEYDGWVFGIPTRYGMMPAQWKAFWDSTGQLWASGKLFGKYASTFVSTSSLGGGQETTLLSTVTHFTHHGINYIPFGYGYKSASGVAFEKLGNLEEVHGGSPWGAGTLTGPTGARQPSPLEKEIANLQGEHFWKTISKVKWD